MTPTLSEMCFTIDRSCAINILVRPLSFCSLTSKDVVRHPLVQQIVKAYETYEAKENARSRERGREKERTRRIRRQ